MRPLIVAQSVTIVTATATVRPLLCHAAIDRPHTWPREPLTRSAQMHTTSCYVVDDGVSYASI